MSTQFINLSESDLIQLDHTSCNLCKKDNAVNYLNKEIRGFAKKEVNFVKCRSCQLVYLNPRFSKESLQRLYDSQEYFQGKNQSIGYFDYIDEQFFRQKTAYTKIKAIEKQLGKKGKLLEIGCASGFFLDVAQKAGWETTGLDISEPMVNYAKNTFGLNVILGPFEEIEPSTHPILKETSFDVVVCWGTTGTFTQPLENFIKINRLLKEDGLFIFNASNINSLTAKLLGSNWFLLGPSSAHLYSKKTITCLLQRSGFQKIKMRTDSHYVTLYKMTSKLPLIFWSGLSTLINKARSFKISHIPFLFPNLSMIEVYATKKNNINIRN